MTHMGLNLELHMETAVADPGGTNPAMTPSSLAKDFGPPATKK